MNALASLTSHLPTRGLVPTTADRSTHLGFELPSTSEE